jgi:hypothetical protein
VQTFVLSLVGLVVAATAHACDVPKAHGKLPYTLHKPYDEARKLLISDGWRPDNSRSEVPTQNGISVMDTLKSRCAPEQVSGHATSDILMPMETNSSWAQQERTGS